MTPEQFYDLADEQCLHGPSDYEGCGHPCRECVSVQINAAIAEGREACVVRKHEDGFWLILHNEKGDAAINLLHEHRGPIVQAVIEAAAIRAQP